ncbi:unnamed protein product, partial [Amoebophrya sp. A25]
VPRRNDQESFYSRDQSGLSSVTVAEDEGGESNSSSTASGSISSCSTGATTMAIGRGSENA